MPITSDGKEPDLEPFINEIQTAVSKAVRKARKPTPEPDETSLLPKRRRGRQSPEAEDAYREKVKVFCKLILQINSTLDFAVGSRGWCYLLEHHGLRKGDFDAGEKLITDCRKSGDLPLDICAEDASRDAIGVEEIDKLDVSAKADAWSITSSSTGTKSYLPITLWDELDVYVEVATEKLRLAQPVRAGVPRVACADHQLQGLVGPQRPCGDDAPLRLLGGAWQEVRAAAVRRS